jgi:Transglycosylase SLT domain
MAIPPFIPGPLSFNGAKASPEVASAIHKASATTGVDFSYLVAQAGQESSFRPDAKAGTSSAAGLYQFVDSTWLTMIRDKGAAYGLGDLAAQIDTTGAAPRVADAAMRRKILDLRNDPAISSVMAAEYAKSNQAQLAQNLNRTVNPTDLYMAHFLGASGATKFLSALDNASDTAGAKLLPDAAAANRGVFYNADGSPRTVAQIYDHYARRFGDAARQITAPPTTSAAVGAFSSASTAHAAILSALVGEKLSPVTIEALMKLGVPGALTRHARS